MSLGTDDVGMDVAGQLEDLHYWVAGVPAGEYEPSLFQLLNVLGVDFVAVAKSHADSLGFGEEVGCEGVGGEVDVLSAKSHVAAETFDLFLFGEDINDGLSAIGVDLGAVGIG